MEAATVDSTPVTTIETPSAAAPTTVAPSPSSSTSQRPTTPDELSSWMRSHATADDPPVVASEASAATAQPTTPDPNAVSVDPPGAKEGPIPFEVHKKALDNARVKAVAEFREAPEFKQATDFAGRITSNATGFWGEFTRELLQHPDHGPVLRAELGRMFGSLRQPAQPAAQPMPGPDIEILDAAGQVTGTTYSAGRLAERDAWNRSQILAEFQKELQPIKAEREQRAADAKAAETTKQVTAAADQYLSRIEKILDGRKELFGQVNALMDADKTLDALDAALQVRETVIVPASKADAQRTALETNLKKAAGNTAGHSGSATPMKRPTNQEELAAYMRALDR